MTLRYENCSVIKQDTEIPNWRMTECVSEQPKVLKPQVCCGAMPSRLRKSPAF
jgi:hypothetical protein